MSTEKKDEKEEPRYEGLTAAEFWAREKECLEKASPANLKKQLQKKDDKKDSGCACGHDHDEDHGHLDSQEGGNEEE